ncbi:hypothetical protein RchiOBHm_Chr2g0100631 [Rosa chinensis]|uniref:Uncharacterized protein n=1 Tax=Rosa chinensis TaxID=74649 RepID=A0A2P6RM60_ROSCH|nr:hypothetical protein RchiOBHm_Chr2g0100631 [Rosa chinensis]
MSFGFIDTNVVDWPKDQLLVQTLFYAELMVVILELVLFTSSIRED